MEKQYTWDLNFRIEKKEFFRMPKTNLKKRTKNIA